MARITPTIGRKLYYYENEPSKVSMSPGQPFDATVIYVWPSEPPGSELLNLFVIDHVGGVAVHTSVPLVQENDVIPQVGGYAKWMPYQVAQATQSTEPQNESSTTSTSETAPVAPAVAATPESSDASASPIPASTIPEPTGYNLDFGGALAALRDGKTAARAGWSGKAFVYLVPAASYPAQTGAAKSHFGEGALVPYKAYLAIKQADGEVCVFVPGMDSILAEDWLTV